jgi:Mrp family chromosome partitioning ATPase
MKPMERIQRALDLAKAPRPQATPPVEDPRTERDVLNREFSVSTVEFVERLPLDWEMLREKRVIAAGNAEPAGHAYRMLRTQVLHRARAHGLNTIGVVSAVNGEGKTLTASTWH